MKSDSQQKQMLKQQAIEKLLNYYVCPSELCNRFQVPLEKAKLVRSQARLYQYRENVQLKCLKCNTVNTVRLTF